MDERSSRIFFGLCMLVLVWIGVYWMWQPRREQKPVITFATQPIVDEEGAPHDPDPELVDQPTDLIPAPDQVVEQEPVADTKSNEPEDSGVKLIAPQFIEHIVAPNELMQTIAKHYFGSIDDWPVIAKANPRVDPRKLKQGMVLRIPTDKNNIQGVLIGEETQPGVIVPRTDTGSKVIEYVVRPGDSLSMISQRIYGSSRHAKFIYESNRDVLRSMDAISVGQLLKLPPIADDESNPDG